MAVDVKELRQGNWIFYGSQPFQVTDLGETGVINLTYSEDGGHTWVFSEEECSGIPLSADLLLELGFEKKAGWPLIGLADPEHETWDRWDDLTLIKLTKGKYPNADGLHYYYLGGRPTTRITYLHQLMNLVYALTGKELTYTNTSK